MYGAEVCVGSLGEVFLFVAKSFIGCVITTDTPWVKLAERGVHVMLHLITWRRRRPYIHTCDPAPGIMVILMIHLIPRFCVRADRRGNNTAHFRQANC